MATNDGTYPKAGPQEVVNVIAWRRPEFLHATLIRLAIAHHDGLHYRINIDHEPDNAIYPPIGQFAEKVGADNVELVERGPHHNPGPTRNILSALHESMEYGAEFVHSIEDDIFINKGYFEYHRSAHRLNPKAFCTTAYAPQPKMPFLTVDRTLATLRAYAPTVAISFRTETLARILKWLPLSYLDDMIGYNARVFRDHPAAPHEWAGIDGALGRVRRRMNLTTVYPIVNRAYHAGYVSAPCAGGACNNENTRDGINNGPHRHGSELTGSVEERAHELLSLNADDLNALSDPVTRDYTWVDLDADYGPVIRLVR